MFISSLLYAVVAICVMVLLGFLVHYVAEPVSWGDVSQALIYHQVRKYLLKMDVRRSHAKFWRPSLLLVLEHPSQSLNLIQFCNSLKKGGLYIVGSVLVGDPQELSEAYFRLRSAWLTLVDLLQIKAFTDVSVASDRASAVRCSLCEEEDKNDRSHCMQTTDLTPKC